MIKFKTKITVTASDIEEEIVSVYGVERPELASLFWEGDYMNDCYKSLWIEEEADKHDYGDEEDEEDEDEEDEEDNEMRKLIRQHLRQCFPGVDHVLVDVSW